MTTKKAAAGTFQINVERWPRPAPDGRGGVFETGDYMQMAEALADLNSKYDYSGSLHIGDNKTEVGAWVLHIGKNGQPGCIVTEGVVLVYFLDMLKAMTTEQFEETFGSKP